MQYSFGNIFHEELLKGRRKRSKSGPLPSSLFQRPSFDRLIIFIVFFVLGFAVLISRLFGLSVIEGERYRKLSEENRVRENKILAPRGIIYDRNHQALVRNIPVFIGDESEYYFEKEDAPSSGEYIEGVAREYIFGDLFAHVLGYTGEISEEELKDIYFYAEERSGVQGYRSGDIVGKMGLERQYDRILRGKDGKTLSEVDAIGNQVRVLGKIDPVAGGNIDLTLDISLQKKVKELMEGKNGAVVVTDPGTGEILALFSSPSFDPNSFIKNKNIELIFENKDNPLFNRAISGLYPPGSTFKLITAVAALEEGAIDADTKVEDVGILKVGNYSYGNWYFTQYGRKEGMVDIIGALKRSNDIYFYKTGEALGIDKLASWARKMGVEKILGIDIKGEEKGLMPDPKWREEEKGEDWYLGNTYHVAIGQGDLLTTPLQVNAWTNIIANGGKLCRPYLLKHAENTGKLERCEDLNIKKDTIDLVREGMKQACSPAPDQGGTAGTGWPLFQFMVDNEDLEIDNLNFQKARESTFSAKPMVGIPVACKTGTAEFAGPKDKTHAWFTVFAPVYDPQISVTVLYEEGGEGSSDAGPIAKEILKQWFENPSSFADPSSG